MVRSFAALLALKMFFLLPALAPAAADAHGEKSNPIFPATPDLGIWTLIVFLCLYFFMRQKAWLPILAGLKNREATIRAAVEDARKARDETQRTRADFEAKLKETYAEIPKMIDEARREAEAIRERIRTEALTEIAGERGKLRQEVETSKEEALNAIHQQAAQLADLITHKAVGRSLGPAVHDKKTKEALAEIHGGAQ